MPDSVARIGNYAFRSCAGLTNVDLPTSLKHVGEYAFYGCTGWDALQLPPGVESIARCAFCQCSRFPELILPNSITNVGVSAFDKCSSVTSLAISTSLTNIEYGTFSNLKALTEVTVPEGIESIGQYAFSGCGNLRSFRIPPTVAFVDDYAFNGCGNIKEVHISDLAAWCCVKFGGNRPDPPNTWANPLSPGKAALFLNGDEICDLVVPDGIGEVMNHAFYYCTNLTSVVLSDSVTNIAKSAFCYCSGITNIVFSRNLKGIGSYAFNQCPSLRSVSLPESLSTLGMYAFSGCVSLENVRVPGTVDAIGQYAFSGCTALNTVTVEEGVTKIGVGAFCDATQLTAVSIPTGVQSVGANAFANCGSFVVSIADGATEICDNAFANCKTLTAVAIPSTVTNIGNSAFLQCSNLVSLSLPLSLERIGNNAFNGCAKISELEFPAALSEIGAQAFANCDSIGELFVHGNVRSIGERAFSDMECLSNVVINAKKPEGYRCPAASILLEDGDWLCEGDGAYKSAPTMDFNPYYGYYDVPTFKIKVSGEAATISFAWKLDGFYEYGSYNTVGYLSLYVDGNEVSWMPDNSSYEAGDFMFWAHNSVSLSAGTHILEWRYYYDPYYYDYFPGDAWVRDISIVSQPVGGGLEIAPDAFCGSSNIANVVTDDLMSWNGIVFGNAFANPVAYAGSLKLGDEVVRDVHFEEGTRRIGDWAFDGCVSVTNIQVCDGVEYIGTAAFRNCAIRSVIVPATVSSLGMAAFAGCRDVVNVVADASLMPCSQMIPASYGGIKSYSVSEGSPFVCDSAFADCVSLEVVTVPASVTNIAENAFTGCNSLSRIIVDRTNGFYSDVGGVLYSKDGTKMVRCPPGTVGAYTLPDEVTMLSQYAFNNCNMLTEIFVPMNLMSLPVTAFERCTSLEKITVASENANYMDIDGVVFTKDGKTLVLYPRGRRGNYTIPDGVAEIADSAFAGCIYLTGVTFSDSVLKIGASAFQGCKNISNIELNTGLYEIGNYAFCNCSALTGLSVPETVTKVGKGAFSDCIALGNLVLPENIQLDPELLDGYITGTKTLTRGMVYLVNEYLSIEEGAELNIPSGVIVKMGPGAQIYTFGTLNAVGTRSSPVIFTSVNDDTVGGDTNGDGGETEASSGDWRYIWVLGRANLEYTKVLYGGMADSSYGERGLLMTDGSGELNMNGCILAHSLYDGIWNWGGSIVATNCVITDTGWAVAPYNGSRNEYINCVFYGNDVILCYWSHWSGRPVFKNCIFAECGRGWCEVDENTYGDMPSAVTVKNSLFWNSRESGAQSCGLVGENGNIWGDPLFADDNYRISIESPCVDAGDGKVAPSADYFGQTRQNIYEDATGTPDADGNYPDIGIHEVMPHVVENDVDFAVMNVESPETFVVGQKATVSWNVKNLGSKPASGSWNDTVELVCANGSIIPLGTLPVSVELATGGTRTFSGTFTVPSAQVGAVRVRVTTNANRDIFEGTLTANNSAESEAATLTMPELAFSA